MCVIFELLLSRECFPSHARFIRQLLAIRIWIVGHAIIINEILIIINLVITLTYGLLFAIVEDVRAVLVAAHCRRPEEDFLLFFHRHHASVLLIRILQYAVDFLLLNILRLYRFKWIVWHIFVITICQSYYLLLLDNIFQSILIYLSAALSHTF